MSRPESHYLICLSGNSSPYWNALGHAIGLVLLEWFVQESEHLIACSGEKTAMVVLVCPHDERGDGGMLC